MRQIKRLSKRKKIKVLFLYDFKDWAIYNVGKLWLADNSSMKVTYLQYKDFKKNMHHKYDLIWFGFSDIFFFHLSRFNLDKRLFYKYVVTIHDPLEIFPQRAQWQHIHINKPNWWNVGMVFRWAKLDVLKSLINVVTTSKEMQQVLQKYGVKSKIIRTTSFLPIKDKRKIKTAACRILSVFEDYPRKDLALLNAVKGYFRESKTTMFNTKIGKKILPLDQYIALLDNHEIYICTSYQEGGPLPAMDAMHRGLVVLTTPVGQIQELIKNGINGFICKSHEEFIAKITVLSADLASLQKMRINSLDTIKKKRNRRDIKKSVQIYIERIVQANKNKEVNLSKNSYLLNKTKFLKELLFNLTMFSLINMVKAQSKLLHMTSISRKKMEGVFYAK